MAAGLPGSKHPTIIFENCPERWPNPVAYLCNEDLWKDAPDMRVPWMMAHGDLNPQNILCPSYLRASALRLTGKTFKPVEFLRHIRLIDTPFCRECPFTYRPRVFGELARSALAQVRWPRSKRQCAGSLLRNVKSGYSWPASHSASGGRCQLHELFPGHLGPGRSSPRTGCRRTSRIVIWPRLQRPASGWRSGPLRTIVGTQRSPFARALWL